MTDVFYQVMGKTRLVTINIHKIFALSSISYRSAFLNALLIAVSETTARVYDITKFYTFYSTVSQSVLVNECCALHATK